MTYRIGVDIGGTFTDVVVIDEATAAIHVVKVPTTPADPSEGFLDGLAQALARFSILPADIAFLVHGTTIATNTIIEGKGAQAGLITSLGFSDVLEIAYQTRPTLYDVFYDKPKPLIPRFRCIGVPERIGPDGAVLTPLDEPAVEAAAHALVAAGAESIAIAFLHAYRDPTHERRAAAAIARAVPGLPVILSSDVCPEYREYPRTSTAVVNAVLLPKVGPYIARLEQRLAAQGIATPLHLMTSSGGIIGAATAKALPVHLVESGPAAGVIGAAFIAQHLADPTLGQHILALDIGGTTAKVALVDDGKPALADEFEVGAAARPTTTAGRGQGYPVKTPVISLVEIGAGGGSIARIDQGGALTVGPESAGAVPGPACYARGGAHPTITDANLVLGRLDPGFFLGGALTLDLEAARAAIATLATAMNLGIEQTAQAIVDIANAKMIAALDFISVQRGIDPRAYALVPSGGGGPLHAAAIAGAMGIRTVIIPPTPGLNSALGLLATDVKHDLVRTIYRRIAKYTDHELWSQLDDMAATGTRLLTQNDIPTDRQSIHRKAELSYLGQSYSLASTVEAREGPETLPNTLEYLDQDFRAQHRQKYGFASPADPTLLTTLRVTAIGRIDRPTLHAPAPKRPVAPKAHRPVFFANVPVETQVYDRTDLPPGHTIHGPAIIEQMDTTTLLPPGAQAITDPSGALIITLTQANP